MGYVPLDSAARRTITVARVRIIVSQDLVTEELEGIALLDSAG
jgi:hypothetical protein